MPGGRTFIYTVEKDRDATRQRFYLFLYFGVSHPSVIKPPTSPKPSTTLDYGHEFHILNRTQLLTDKRDIRSKQTWRTGI